jgi:hypothetical protein
MLYPRSGASAKRPLLDEGAAFCHLHPVRFPPGDDQERIPSSCTLFCFLKKRIPPLYTDLYRSMSPKVSMQFHLLLVCFPKDRAPMHRVAGLQHSRTRHENCIPSFIYLFLIQGRPGSFTIVFYWSALKKNGCAVHRCLFYLSASQSSVPDCFLLVCFSPGQVPNRLLPKEACTTTIILQQFFPKLQASYRRRTGSCTSICDPPKR